MEITWIKEEEEREEKEEKKRRERDMYDKCKSQ